MTPTAHREIHHRQVGERLNKELLKIVHEKERQIGSLGTLWSLEEPCWMGI